MEAQKFLNSQRNPEQKINTGTIITDFKLYCRAIVMKTALTQKQTHRLME
jgi:hypothetical protein